MRKSRFLLSFLGFSHEIYLKFIQVLAVEIDKYINKYQIVKISGFSNLNFRVSPIEIG